MLQKKVIKSNKTFLVFYRSFQLVTSVFIFNWKTLELGQRKLYFITVVLSQCETSVLSIFAFNLFKLMFCKYSENL
jgi:hypothetical protein